MCERERVRGRMRVVCEREGESECGREERECERRERVWERESV